MREMFPRSACCRRGESERELSKAQQHTADHASNRAMQTTSLFHLRWEKHQRRRAR